MNEWQPIDTAPTDGTVVLGLLPIGLWRNSDYCVTEIKMGSGQWLIGADLQTPEEMDAEPTHWMPRPLPPNTEVKPTREAGSA